jgi:D-3-phosphoglycerate dehydrogenase/(S)-sulfolactate dehydrogenase
MILISEDVWGTPFQVLEGSFPILRNDNLWSNPDELKAAIADATALVVRNRTKVTADVIAAAPKLKVIARAGVGLDNIDVAYATDQGIKVYNTPKASTQVVAELTLSFMLALSRQITFADQSMKHMTWEKND